MPARHRRWLWLAVLLGAGLRLYLLLATEGSFDVHVKLQHASRIHQLGLMEYYRQAQVFNHPPPMGGFFLGLGALAQATGIPFRWLLRAPFALLDAGTALLLVRAFEGSSRGIAVAALYWLHPLALIFSAYHGNTDTAVAFFLLLALVLSARGRAVAAGIALGAGLCVKLPVLIGAPALFFALPGWRERGRFALAAGLVAGLGYLPLLLEPGLLWDRVIGYPGTGVETPRGVIIWGIVHTLGLAGSGVAGWLGRYNTPVCWLPILLFAWLRRNQTGARELGISVCGSFLILYGFTSFWSWQYLAWSLPFWFFLDPRWTAAATLLMGSYVYGAYVVFTGNPWLLGRWDFMRHGPWPPLLDLLRHASVLFCFLSAWVLLLRAIASARHPGKAEAAA